MRLACLVAAALALMPIAGRAGTLVEARFDGVPIKAELSDPSARLVRVEVGTTNRLVDLADNTVFVLGKGEAKRIRAGALDDGASILPWSLSRWSHGPVVAGNASSYNVLTLGEAICGEVLASVWMGPFLEPVTRALGLLQRVDKRLRPREHPHCGAVPFDVYARNGWPLMAGWKDAPIFTTTKVSFDAAIPAGDLSLPARFVDCSGNSC